MIIKKKKPNSLLDRVKITKRFNLVLIFNPFKAHPCHFLRDFCFQKREKPIFLLN